MGRTGPGMRGHGDDEDDQGEDAGRAGDDWDDEPDDDWDDDEPVRRRRRRASRRGRSASAVLVPTTVLLVLSFALVASVWAIPDTALRAIPGSAFDVPPYLVCFGVYLLVGATTYLRPLQRVVVGLLFGARSPTRAEQRKLGPAWQAVRRRARVSADMYLVLVVDDPGPTAVATGGSILMVTTGALQTLTSEELEGILAHELGHHVGLHDVALPIAHWLALPVVAVAQVGRLLSEVPVMQLTLLTRLVARLALLALLVLPVRLVIGFFVGGLLVDDPVVWVASLAGVVAMGALLMASGPVTRRLGRLVSDYTEPHADRVADRLGFGPVLADALDRFHGKPRDTRRYGRVVSRRIFAARNA